MKIRKYSHRYPWVRWFMRRRFTLLRGRDFFCRPDTMAQMVRHASRKRRFNVLKVSVEISDDEKEVRVRVIHRE